MPKVPVSENRVQTRSANVEPLKVGMLSDAVAGNNVFEAQQNLSKTIGKGVQGFIDYGVQQLEKENERNFLTKEAELKKEINNIAFDPTSDDKGNPKGVLNRKLGQVDSNLTTEYSTRVDEVVNNAGIDLNENSRARLRSSLMNHSEALRDNVVKHQIGQIEQNDKNIYESSIASSIDSATLAQSPETLGPIVEDIKSRVESRMTIQGMDSESIKLAKQEAVDKAIGASALARLEQEPLTAKAILESNKDNVSNAFYQKTLRTIEGKVFEVKRSGLYSDVFSRMKLSNGEPDLARIEKSIRSSGQFKTEGEKEQMVSYAKSRAMEDLQNKNRYDKDLINRFSNDVIKLKKDGGTLDEAFKIAGGFGGDEVDVKDREDIAKKLWTDPSAKSDPETVLALHEKILSGGASKAEIKQAFADNKINAVDYVRITKEQIGNTIGEDKKDMKMAYDAFKNEVNAKFNSTEKEDKANALMVFRQKTEGKTPEEAALIGKQLLESSVVSKGFFFDTKKENFKIEKEKIDANNEAWGTFYQAIGQKEVNAIGGGITRKENRSWGIDDLNKFAQEFGGVEAIKAGTPVNNAIKSLAAKGKMATPANVKAVLAIYKDGNY